MSELAIAAQPKIVGKKYSQNKTALTNAGNTGVEAIMRKANCACGGNCPKCKAAINNLNISQPSDPAEVEADQIADQIVRLKANPGVTQLPGEFNVSAVQKKSGNTTGAKPIPASLSAALSDTGRELNASTRAKMELHFKTDFSDVRIHTGKNAVESSNDINARAYTLGRDIVFNQHQYSPETFEGERLIAHELTHVVQQRNGVAGNVLQREALIEEVLEPNAQEPILLDEEHHEENENETEEEGDEEDDFVEDGDTEVSDLIEYPELPELPNDPEPMPVEPVPDDLTLTGFDDAEQMKGGGKAKKIKSILVDQPTQKMTITFNDGTTKKHNVSTGRGDCGTKDDPCKSQNSHGCTPNGTYTIVFQGNATTKNSTGDAMAWFVGLKVPGRSGIGIHNSQPVPGIPHSHGCVRTGNSAQDGGMAEMINKGVTYGATKVTIQGKAKTTPYKCKKKKKDGKKGGKKK